MEVLFGDKVRSRPSRLLQRIFFNYSHPKCIASQIQVNVMINRTLAQRSHTVCDSAMCVSVESEPVSGSVFLDVLIVRVIHTTVAGSLSNSFRNNWLECFLLMRELGRWDLETMTSAHIRPFRSISSWSLTIQEIGWNKSSFLIFLS